MKSLSLYIFLATSASAEEHALFDLEEYIKNHKLDQGKLECGISTGYHSTLYDTTFVPTDHHPWFVRIEITEIDSQLESVAHECTGVFISRRSILTTASCMGDTHHTSHRIRIYVPLLKELVQFNYVYDNHPQYRGCTVDKCWNNLGLITLPHDMNTKFFSPICLPHPNMFEPSQMHLVSNFKAVNGYTLQDAPIERVPQSYCKTHMTDDFVLEQFEVGKQHQFFCYHNETVLSYGKSTGSIIVKKLPGPIPHYTLYRVGLENEK